MSKRKSGSWAAAIVHANSKRMAAAPEKKEDKAAIVRANSKLMAAAPDMLRLIQRLTSPHMADMDYRADAYIDALEIMNQLNSDD